MKNYWDFLMLDSLLGLQPGFDGAGPASGAELQFIIVHQIFELSFKLILSDLRSARDDLASLRPDALHRVIGLLGRVAKTFTAASGQWDLLENLKTQDFLKFRDKLYSASGAQSYQFSEIEIILGLEEILPRETTARRPVDQLRRLALRAPGSGAWWQRILKARTELTLRSALYDWIARSEILHFQPGVVEDKAMVEQFIADYVAHAERYHSRGMQGAGVHQDGSRELGQSQSAIANLTQFLSASELPESERPKCRRLRAVLIYVETYGESPLLAGWRELIEQVFECEQALLFWRRRHASVVERIIGHRTGTGGSSVDYLQRTMAFRIFDELWTVRSMILPQGWAPALSAYLPRAVS